MYTLDEQPTEFEALNMRCAGLIGEILTHVPVLKSRSTILSSQTLFSNPAEKGTLYFLVEGMLAYVKDGRTLFFFSEGDLVGLENHFGTNNSKLCSDFAVTVDEYSYQDLKRKIAESSKLQDLWNQYFTTQFNLFSLMISTLVKGHSDLTPMVRFYQSGDIIISQGSEAKEVYNMIEGHADVFVKGIKVGEILTDEIFGALGVLVQKPRTADVIATKKCMVLCLPKEHFVELIETRPHTVLKMVEDMARTIVELNAKVVDYVLKRE